MTDETEKQPDTLILAEVLAQNVPAADLVHVYRFESRYFDETAYWIAQVLLGADGSIGLLRIEVGHINSLNTVEKSDLDAITAFLGVSSAEAFHRCPEREETYRQQLHAKQAQEVALMNAAMRSNPSPFQKGKVH